MKTFTALFTKIFSGFIVSLILSPQMVAQGVSATADKTYIESKKLSDESDKFAEQAAQLRENARYVSGSGQLMMIEEAEALEKLAMTKSALSQKMEYDAHANEYAHNEKQLVSLDKNRKNARNSQQIKYLSEKSVKNRKLANDLYQEAIAQDALALRIGSFQNANEKISEALRQQKDLIQLLKNEGLTAK